MHTWPRLDHRSDAIADEPSGKTAARYVSRPSALPNVFAVFISLLGHALAVTAMVIVDMPVTAPIPAPTPIMVEFVVDPTVRKEEHKEDETGEGNTVVRHDAASNESGAQKTDQIARTDAADALVDLPDPDRIPIPVRRPTHEQPRTEKRVPDRITVAAVKRLSDDPHADVDPGQTLKVEGNTEAALTERPSGDVLPNVEAQKRWQRLLAVHLERRKRYPASALSRRQEGVAYVRFFVGPDGVVIDPELAQSSNVPALDEEVLELVRRASPVPKPPPGVNTFVTVPVRFSVQG